MADHASADISQSAHSIPLATHLAIGVCPTRPENLTGSTRTRPEQVVNDNAINLLGPGVYLATEHEAVRPGRDTL